MANDVLPCFYMNRSYQGNDLNTLASVQSNDDVATTRQLIGGSCSEVTDPSNVCRTPVAGCSTCKYAVPKQIISTINNLQPGQALNLQAYVLVRNSTPAYMTNQDKWDCTNLNPTSHWSNDAERYCWVDFQRIITTIEDNPNVLVTDPEGVAQNWGMSPPTR